MFRNQHYNPQQSEILAHYLDREETDAGLEEYNHIQFFQWTVDYNLQFHSCVVKE